MSGESRCTDLLLYFYLYRDTLFALPALAVFPVSATHFLLCLLPFSLP